MKVLASFQIHNPADIVNSIGTTTYSPPTTVQDLVNDPATPYALEADNGDLFLSFGLEEDETLDADMENTIQGQYFPEAKFAVVEFPEKIAECLIGGHPRYRPGRYR